MYNNVCLRFDRAGAVSVVSSVPIICHQTVMLYFGCTQALRVWSGCVGIVGSGWGQPQHWGSQIDSMALKTLLSLCTASKTHECPASRRDGVMSGSMTEVLHQWPGQCSNTTSVCVGHSSSCDTLHQKLKWTGQSCLCNCFNTIYYKSKKRKIVFIFLSEVEPRAYTLIDT